MLVLVNYDDDRNLQVFDDRRKFDSAIVYLSKISPGGGGHMNFQVNFLVKIPTLGPEKWVKIRSSVLTFGKQCYESLLKKKPLKFSSFLQWFVYFKAISTNLAFEVSTI